MKSAKSLALVYSIISIFIGPGIVLYALGRGKVGTDCSDSSWLSVSSAAKDAYYADAAIIMVLASMIMLILGVFLVLRLLKERQKRKAFPWVSLVVVMMLGYTLIHTYANSWNCT